MRLPRLAAWLCLILSVLLAGIIVHRMVPPAPPRMPFDFGRDRDWNPASAKQQKAAEAVAGGQIDAFRRGDFLRAVSYIGPGGGRREAESMRRRITHDFPEFAHPKRVMFGPAQVQRRGAQVRLPVRVLGDDGFQAIAIYYLYPTPRGYRIGGVAGGDRMTGEPGRRP